MMRPLRINSRIASWRRSWRVSSSPWGHYRVEMARSLKPSANDRYLRRAVAADGGGGCLGGKLPVPTERRQRLTVTSTTASSAATRRQHQQTRRLRRNRPSGNDVRNAIERATVGATRIEILLSQSVVAEGQDRALTLPWTRPSSRRRREIIQGVGEAQHSLRAMRTKARDGFIRALRGAHRWLDELLFDPRSRRLPPRSGNVRRDHRALIVRARTNGSRIELHQCARCPICDGGVVRVETYLIASG